jgi:hypothetical protein
MHEMGANFHEMNYYLTQDERTKIKDPKLQREVHDLLTKAQLQAFGLIAGK